MTVDDIMAQAKTLSRQEQKELIKLLVDALAVSDVTGSDSQKMYRLSDLRGVGADVWQGIDAQEYVDELRDEWDHRP